MASATASSIVSSSCIAIGSSAIGSSAKEYKQEIDDFTKSPTKTWDEFCVIFKISGIFQPIWFVDFVMIFNEIDEINRKNCGCNSIKKAYDMAKESLKSDVIAIVKKRLPMLEKESALRKIGFMIEDSHGHRYVKKSFGAVELTAAVYGVNVALAEVQLRKCGCPLATILGWDFHFEDCEKAFDVQKNKE